MKLGEIIIGFIIMIIDYAVLKYFMTHSLLDDILAIMGSP